MFRKIILNIKDSRLGSLLVKLGIRRLGIARRLYGNLLRANTTKPLNIEGNLIFMDKKDSMGLLQNPNFYTNNDEAEIMKRFVKKGDVVVDIGANIGMYTIFLANLVGPTGKVYAFEPDTTNFNILIKNIRANGHRNVIAVNKAVSNKTGKTKLYTSEWNNGDHRIYSSDEKRNFILIDTLTLDDYFKTKNERIHFVKIDIQGAEALAFEGGKDFFLNKKPIVLQEFWPVGIESTGKNHKDFLELLSSNFKIYSEHNLDKEITEKEILSKVSIKKRNHINLLGIPKKNN